MSRLRAHAKAFKERLTYSVLVRGLSILANHPLANQHHLFLPIEIPRPEGRRFLVLAPHYDDETLGPGGTIAKLSQAGEQIKVVFFTDGRLGNPGNYPDDQLIRMREEESQRAAAVLGIKAVRRLNYPDQRLSFHEALIQAVAAELLNYDPDVVFVPMPLDYHVDHCVAARIAIAAALRTQSRSIPYCYETALPIMPNVLVEISEQIATKEEALRCYHSQLASNDYLHAITQGLNRFRTHGLLKGRGYAEAFFRTTWPFLAALVKTIPLK